MNKDEEANEPTSRIDLFKLANSNDDKPKKPKPSFVNASGQKCCDGNNINITDPNILGFESEVFDEAMMGKSPRRKTISSLATMKQNNPTIVDNSFKFSDDDEGIRLQFKPYNELIENLTNSFIINTAKSDQDTDFIEACELSRDSEFLIIVMRNSDEFYKVQVV